MEAAKSQANLTALVPGVQEVGGEAFWGTELKFLPNLEQNILIQTGAGKCS